MDYPDKPRRRTGRPLSFDREAALHRAMLLFWQHGYESTSIGDLTSAMKVTPPSIYAAFGDKRRLFLEAVARYLSGPVTTEGIIATAPTAWEAARRLLDSAAIGFTGAETPPGCLLATSVISCSAASAPVQAELAAIRRGFEQLLVGRIVDDIGKGELDPGTDAEALAGHVMAVIQGLSTLARDGAKRDKLIRIAAMAMSTWPSGRRSSGATAAAHSGASHPFGLGGTGLPGREVS